MPRERFEHLLSLASTTPADTPRTVSAVRVQWDPERNVALAKLPWRSLQVGVGRTVVEAWVEEGIVGIEVGPVFRWIDG